MNEPQSEPRRTEIVEQAGSPTVRFTIDDHSFILPYAYFVKGECHVRDKDRFLVIGHWNSAKVTILGQHLEQLAQWLAEYRLATVHLRTAVQTSVQDQLPYIEQILIEATDESSSRGKSRRKKPKLLTESIGRP
jgi:hypothetical protein